MVEPVASGEVGVGGNELEDVLENLVGQLVNVAGAIKIIGQPTI